ncbi:S-adenosyl-L-methionine-dependent methyltransferase [Xylariaceae sp. FL1272]|nr:S-adenosyl-L-methionine-dependent methyltransferase [Xylariaceae sp. FL1272]
MASTHQPQHPSLPLPDYFSNFASIYVRQTGHSTFDIVGDVIVDNVQTSANPIGPGSVLHDTAAGPGVGAAALVARLPKEQLPKEILVTDNVPMMVSAARDSLTASDSPLSHVECKELDSEDLSSISDNYFTHSINNFSIFTFIRPQPAVSETYRTLRPGGLAIVTCWRRFAPVLIIQAAQKKMRPDLPLMPVPNPQFLEQGEVQRVVEAGGFAKENIQVVEKSLVVSDVENIAGLTTFMCGPLMVQARAGYTEEEQARWPEAVSQAVKEETDEFGGIRFEAYILLATK